MLTLPVAQRIKKVKVAKPAIILTHEEEVKWMKIQRDITWDLTGGNYIGTSDVVNKPRGGTTDGCQQDMALK